MSFKSIPDFYSVKSSYKDKQTQCDLYLDIGKKNKILNLGFQSTGLSIKSEEYFESFCTALKGQDLYKWASFLAPAPTSEFIDIPFTLLMKCIENLSGKVPNWQDSHCENLLCRCFGIGEGKVLDYLQIYPEKTAEEISQEFNIGVACGTCFSDLEESIQDWRDKRPLFLFSDDGARQRKRNRHKGLTPAEFFTKHLQDLILEVGLEKKKILSFDGDTLWFADQDTKISLLEKLIMEKMDGQIKIKVFDETFH